MEKEEMQEFGMDFLGMIKQNNTACTTYTSELYSFPTWRK